VKFLLLLTGHNNFFGQTRKPWVSIDIEKFIKYLGEFGHKVTAMEFHQAFNQLSNIKDEIVFYTFHQKSEIREYIKDIVYELSKSNNVIPSFDLLKCHENKGYQELLRKSLGIKGLNSYYFSSYKDIDKYDIKYPVILKTEDGSNGTGVFKCNDENELSHKIKSFGSVDVFTKLDLFRRKYFRKEKKYSLYPDYSNEKDLELYSDYVKPEKRFILQEFVPNQMNDYRVVIAYDKYFPLKRYNKINDFRASGSKKFDFSFEPDDALLNKAMEIKVKIDSPMLSIDLIFDERDNSYKLIEFQALHFGISSIIGNKKHYIFDEKWKKITVDTTYEYELAYALDKYIRNM
jgi:glutathione synthase/RimK-type ligase-like ATP-grasp enzyme